MKWLKRLLGNGDQVTILPEVKSSTPMPPVKPPKIVGVSEPVYSFVKFYKENQSRFTYTADQSTSRRHHFTLTDTVTNESWELTVSFNWYCEGSSYYFHCSADWLTQSECHYIWKELVKKPQDEWRQRIAKINIYKRKKRNKSERERLMGVYGQ